jgi:hypothetical protein
MATSIARDELRSAMRAGGVTVVDTLPAFPYGQRHLPGALNLAEEDADAHADDLLPERTRRSSRTSRMPRAVGARRSPCGWSGSKHRRAHLPATASRTELPPASRWTDVVVGG